jgi:hypothetical protein
VQPVPAVSLKWQLRLVWQLRLAVEVWLQHKTDHSTTEDLLLTVPGGCWPVCGPVLAAGEHAIAMCVGV